MGASTRAPCRAALATAAISGLLFGTSVDSAFAQVAPDCGPPAISGVERDGGTLSGTPGNCSGIPTPSLRFEWFRCDSFLSCTSVSAQTQSPQDYPLTPDDVGWQLLLLQTAENVAGTDTDAAVSGVIQANPPVPVSAATVAGSARQGDTLSVASDAEFSGTPPINKTREWIRCSAAGDACEGTGAFSTSYVLKAADVGKRFKHRVTGTGPQGHSAAQDSALSDVVAARPAAPSEKPAPQRPRLMRPFPTVLIVGRAFPSGTRFTAFVVRGPRRARVSASCRGRGCPLRRTMATIRSRSVRLRPLQTNLPAGTVIELKVTKPGMIGKFTRLRIRRGRAPARTDLCLMPGARRPSRCPRSRR